MPSATMPPQVRLDRVTPSHCRVVIENPPLNVMGPEFVSEIRLRRPTIWLPRGGQIARVKAGTYSAVGRRSGQFC
jgi:hypothetical protein